MATRRFASILLVGGLLLAACGSTVQQPQGVSEVASDGLGDLSTDAGTLPPGASVNDKGQVISASGEVLGSAEDFGLSSDGSGTTGGTSTTGGGSSSVGGSGGSGPTATAPGVTADKIYLGITWTDAGEANRAFVGSAIDSDARKYYDAMIEEINKAGGLAGRKVEPIYHRLEASSQQTVAQQMQAACANFTQDHTVYALLAGDNGTGVLKECAKKAGIIQLVSIPQPTLPEDYRKYPHYIETNNMNLIRVGDVTVAGLAREGYYSKGFKLGVVTWDDDNYKRALTEGYLPALKRKGIELATEPAYVTPPQTVGDLSGTGSDTNNAVLRFQSQGITHVMLIGGPAGLCGQACMETLFFRRAESQNYRPRYGLNENNAPTGGYDQGLYPAEQLREAVAVGWSDGDKAADEGTRLNKTREHCYDLMRKHGVPMENVNQENDARVACNDLWFLQLIINARLKGNASVADQFITQVNGLGTSFSSTAAYGTFFSASQHDGIAAARNLKFLGSCNCWKYTTDPYRV